MLAQVTPTPPLSNQQPLSARTLNHAFLEMSKPVFNSTRNKVKITSGNTVILWFRQDLRLSDQPALVAAASAGNVVPVFVLDPESAGQHAIGGASLWWLYHSLVSLQKSLELLGLNLILRKGPAVEEIGKLVKETGASQVHAISHYEPWWIRAQQEIQKNYKLVLHDGNQLMPPGSVTTQAGKPFKIYTPFWRALTRHMPPSQPVDVPKTISSPSEWPRSDSLEDWGLLPTRPNWAKGFEGIWTPGEKGAADRLDKFAKIVGNYESKRDFPSEEATSRLSPHLHYGEISPRTIWLKVADKSSSVHTFLNEVGWRDYAQNILLLYPDIGTENSKQQFKDMPWRSGQEATDDLKRWQRGKTGYPIVDAGMRQLWETGWMHNRVRMITASFLIKHLLIDWREGEKWFWDCLIDADYGSNGVAWQWVAGTGIDSSMWSRMMAPLTQSPKFEAAEYIRTWVPELKSLNDKQIHDPEDSIRDKVGYAKKIIDHKDARTRALEAYKQMTE